VPDENELRELSAVAEIIRQLHCIVGKVLESKILRLAEFRFPAAGAALVIAKRRNLSHGQLRRELLQRVRLDTGSIAVPVRGAGARDQQCDRRALHTGRNCQHGINGADPDTGFFGRCTHGEPANDGEQGEDTKNPREREVAHSANRSSSPLPAA
jgi:hypothetical protein